jgi:16S rRNA G1207 methylase RsmC
MDNTQEIAQARPQEQLLIDLLPKLSPSDVLCTSLGRGQFAVAAAELWSTNKVTCWYGDQHHLQLADATNTGKSQNLDFICTSDLPTNEVGLVAIPSSATGEAEMTCDLLQSAYNALAIGGTLLTSTNNPRDHWLSEQITRFTKKIKRFPAKSGVAYSITKTEPLKKIKNYFCEFKFRDGERLLSALSRPSVFSHRKVDAGCRQILKAMEIQPNQHVLDLGCGSGVVAIAAATREPTTTVFAIDSNARAVDCAQRGAALNNLTNISAVLSSDYRLSPDQQPFDIVFANPPYYANYEIARRFLEIAHAVLSPGGKILLVTKSPTWYDENFSGWFKRGQIEQSKDYWLVSGFR